MAEYAEDGDFVLMESTDLPIGAGVVRHNELNRSEGGEG